MKLLIREKHKTKANGVRGDKNKIFNNPDFPFIQKVEPSKKQHWRNDEREIEMRRPIQAFPAKRYLHEMRDEAQKRNQGENKKKAIVWKVRFYAVKNALNTFHKSFLAVFKIKFNRAKKIIGTKPDNDSIPFNMQFIFLPELLLQRLSGLLPKAL